MCPGRHAKFTPQLPLELADPVGMLDVFRFNWVDDQGAAWSTQTKLEVDVPRAVVHTYSGQIFRSARPIGSFKRQVRRGPEGLWMTHVALTVPPELRGKGFSTAFWTASLHAYLRQSITRVEIHADDDGRIFWARDPVRFKDADQPRRLLENWASREGARGKGAYIKAAAACRIEPAAVNSMLEQVCARAGILTPAELYGTCAGRLLLGGASWHGTVDLKTAFES